MRRWLKRLVVAGVGLVLAGWLAGVWLLRSWTAKPPPLPAETSILKARPESREGKVWLGSSSFSRREGLPVVHLKGTPLEMGYANGVLLRDFMHTLEREFLDMLQTYVPSDATLQVLKWYVIYRNRRISEFIPLDYRMEIYGATLGCPDSHPEWGDYYNRMLNYHAAHDVSYMMIDNPLVSQAGCTSFGLWGDRASGGHLITGRNFDWEAAEVFGRDRVVQMYEPSEGIPFIALSWAGMAGVISGMNRAGVSVSINGAPSGLPRQTATPVAIVAREILQTARNLDQALALVRKANVFVSTLWLVGSREDGRFVVIEKTPDTTQVREAEGESIVCANHFQSPALLEDPLNQSQTAEATSVSRQKRLEELIARSPGPVDASRAAAFLRDRALPGGHFAGNGHRGSLNALIATHATVMDLTAGIFYAASPPYQLGKFVAFDVNDFDRERPELSVAPDPALESGDIHRALQARQCLSQGRRALGRKAPHEALRLAEKAEALNPGFYQNAMLRGDALAALGRDPEARAAREAALAARPAFLAEQREIEGLLRTTPEDP